MLVLLRAFLEDSEAIANCTRNAYRDEIHKFDNKDRNVMHPTIDEVKHMMEHNFDYKIVLDYNIIGGVIVMSEGARIASIQDFCIEPFYQNKGYGQLVLKEVERLHEDIEKWELTTPVYSVGNQYLYEKCGYKRVKIDDFGGVLCIFYEKNTV